MNLQMSGLGQLFSVNNNASQSKQAKAPVKMDRPIVDRVQFSGNDQARLEQLTRQLVDMMFERVEELRPTNPAINQLMTQIESSGADLNGFKAFLAQVEPEDTVESLEEDIASFQSVRGTQEESQGLTMILSIGFMAYQMSQGGGGF